MNPYQLLIAFRTMDERIERTNASHDRATHALHVPIAPLVLIILL